MQRDMGGVPSPVSQVPQTIGRADASDRSSIQLRATWRPFGPGCGMGAKWKEAALKLAEQANQGHRRLLEVSDTLCLEDFKPNGQVSRFLSRLNRTDESPTLPTLELHTTLKSLDEALRDQLKKEKTRLSWYNWYFNICLITYVESRLKWGEGDRSRPAKAAPVGNAMVDTALLDHGAAAFRVLDAFSSMGAYDPPPLAFYPNLGSQPLSAIKARRAPGQVE